MAPRDIVAPIPRWYPLGPFGCLITTTLFAASLVDSVDALEICINIPDLDPCLVDLIRMPLTRIVTAVMIAILIGIMISQSLSSSTPERHAAIAEAALREGQDGWCWTYAVTDSITKRNFPRRNYPKEVSVKELCRICALPEHAHMMPAPARLIVYGDFAHVIPMEGGRSVHNDVLTLPDMTKVRMDTAAILSVFKTMYGDHCAAMEAAGHDKWTEDAWLREVVGNGINAPTPARVNELENCIQQLKQHPQTLVTEEGKVITSSKNATNKPREFMGKVQEFPLWFALAKAHVTPFGQHESIARQCSDIASYLHPQGALWAHQYLKSITPGSVDGFGLQLEQMYGDPNIRLTKEAELKNIQPMKNFNELRQRLENCFVYLTTLTKQDKADALWLNLHHDLKEKLIPVGISAHLNQGEVYQVYANRLGVIDGQLYHNDRMSRMRTTTYQPTYKSPMYSNNTAGPSIPCQQHDPNAMDIDRQVIPNDKCYWCGETGHFARDCTLTKVLTSYRPPTGGYPQRPTRPSQLQRFVAIQPTSDSSTSPGPSSPASTSSFVSAE